MEIKNLIKKNRSYRRFDSSVAVPAEQLAELMELTRYTASARNMQPLRYLPITGKEATDRVFPLLAWAGYLPDWPGPSENERPAAYIIVCKESALADGHTLFDAGIATQTILLGAVEMGLGGCIIGAVNKSRLKEVTGLSDRYEILYVIALGKPAEQVVIDDLCGNGSVKYWRDEKQVHHVPKRKLNDLIIKI